jgi:hypothetical protein
MEGISNTTFITTNGWDMVMKLLKRNSFPFYILFFIHSLLLAYSFYKSNDRKKLFALLMSNIGFAYLFEYFVLNIFKAYTYKPKVIKNSYHDNILGAILSQAIFVPFTAVLLTSQKIGWIGKVLGGGYFSLVEILFIRLKVYKHHWWKTIFTFLLIPIYFKLSDIWKRYLDNNNEIVKFTSLFLMNLVTEANLLFLFAAFRKLRFGIGKYHSWYEHFILVPCYAISISLFAAWSLLKRNDWVGKMKVLLFVIGINKLFIRLKLAKNKFHFVDFLVIRITMVYIFGQFKEWVYGDKAGFNG